jgi:hypothetical protein
MVNVFYTKIELDKDFFVGPIGQIWWSDWGVSWMQAKTISIASCKDIHLSQIVKML